ncbi:hypothetical protein BDZ45DRAFT_75561 [Acephala macrosclerotiorum]|nr:hypothetical protein BDZ45DRAFT_75561 [Acephala macrosclerotiorum]
MRLITTVKVRNPLLPEGVRAKSIQIRATLTCLKKANTGPKPTTTHSLDIWNATWQRGWSDLWCWIRRIILLLLREVYSSSAWIKVLNAAPGVQGKMSPSRMSPYLETLPFSWVGYERLYNSRLCIKKPDIQKLALFSCAGRTLREVLPPANEDIP